MILTNQEAAWLLQTYSRFITMLTWYRMYCVMHLSTNLSDYIRGYEKLKLAYENLGWTGAQNKSVDKLIKQIENILWSERLTSEDLIEIASLIKAFQEKREDNFRDEWFKAYLVDETTVRRHSAFLNEMTSDLMAVQKYDAALITAFKYMDSYLQQLLKVPAHEYYGEKLINHAFAPALGKLQLKTGESEQAGLRNLVSGANALFRNPSAHRSVDYTEFSASVVISLVALICEISDSLYKPKKKKPRQSRISR